MHILIVSQYFFPEEFKINDLVRELLGRGHIVTVLTGKPNYPNGEYFDGYMYKGIVKEDFCGAEVIRVPLRKRGVGGAINLVWNYLSFVVNANKYIHGHKMAFDAILCYEVSPITQAFPALYCKKKYGGKVLLWIQDLWPESVTAAGGIKNSFVIRFLGKMVKRIYEKCDVLLVQSEAFKESILAYGDFSSKIVFAPNWAEDIYLKNKMMNEEKIAQMIPDGFRVMFAGNVGKAQDVDAIIKAAKRTQVIPNIKWIIVGDGRAREELEYQAKQMGLKETVFFLGRHPMEQMPTFFSYADVMVVSLKNEYIFSLTIPAKTQSYMASGKPIVSMLSGEGNRIVDKAHCGLTADSGDYEALADNVIALSKMTKEELHTIGMNGLDFYLDNYDKNKVVDTIIQAMKS